MEDVPLAIAPFQGRAMVGVGKLLRIYDLGKKKLLRKCENKVRRGAVYTNVHVLERLSKKDRVAVHKFTNLHTQKMDSVSFF